MVSKVILNDEKGQPLCVVDIGENPDLSPHFATPAPPDFSSSLSVDLRPCDLSERELINYVAQNSVLGPTKVAVAPLALGGWALLSCVAGAGVVAATAAASKAAAMGTAAGVASAGAAAAAGTAAAIFAVSMTGAGVVGVATLTCFGGALYFLLEDWNTSDKGE